MHAAAARNHAVLFNRFDLVRRWAETGDLNLESAARADQPRITADLNACLGQALARVLLLGAGQSSP
jgi:hypothetical protein